MSSGRTIVFLSILALAMGGVSRADEAGEVVRRLHARYESTLCVLSVALETEDSKRAEVSYPGVTIAPSGLAMVPLPPEMFDYPRSYFQQLELMRPGKPAEGEPARLIGVNELFDLAFVEPTAPAASQPFIDFSLIGDLPEIGQPVVCLGLLEEDLGYRCSFELGRMGPPVGSDDFTISGVPTDASGTLLFDISARLVGIARPPARADEEFLVRQNRTAEGFIVQSRATRAAALRRAVAFAIKERRDWPDPWIGVAGLQVADRDICEAYGLDPATVAIIVGAVVDGYPAQKAGLRPKDFIVKLNGQPLGRGATDDETLDIWTTRMKHQNVGDTVTLGVWRDRQEHELKLTLAEAPLSETKADREFTPALGMAVREIVFRDRFDRRLDKRVRGVVVAHLVQSGPAETAELEEGDIIERIDETPVPDLATYRQVVAKRVGGNLSDLVFSVLRGSSQRLVVRVDLAATSRPAEGP